MFLASLYGLPPEPFEAAMIDRANAWQTFRYLTLPMLRPAIFIVVVLRTMIALRAFEGIYATTVATLVLAIPAGYAFGRLRFRGRKSFAFGFISTEEHLWGAFTASGTMIMVPVIVLALAAQRHIVHGLTLGAVGRARR